MPAPTPTPAGETFAGALRPGPQMPPPNLAGLLRAQMQKEQDAEALRFSRAVAPVEKKIKRWIEVPVDSTNAPGAFAFYGEKKVGGLTFDTVREPMYEDDTEEVVYKRAQDNFYKNIKDRDVYQTIRAASDLTFNVPYLVPGVSSFMEEFTANNPAMAKDADLKSLAGTLYLSGLSKIAGKMPLNYAFNRLAQGGAYLARAGVLRMLATKPGSAFVQGASSILDAGKPMVQGVQATLPGQISPPSPFFHWMGEKFGQQVFQRVRPAIVAQVQQTLQRTGAIIQSNGEIVVPAGTSSAAYQEARNAIALLKQELGSTAPVAMRRLQGGATVSQVADWSRRMSGGQTLVQTVPNVFGSTAAGAGVAAGYAVPLMLSPDLNMDQRKEIARTIPAQMLQGAAFAGGMHMLGLMSQEFSRTLAKPRVVSNRVLGSKGDVVEPGTRPLPGPFGPRTPSPALTRVKIEPLRVQTPVTPETAMVQNNLGKNLHEMSQEELVNATSDLGMPQALQPLEDLRLTLRRNSDALSRLTDEIQETARALQDPKELAKMMRGVVALRQVPPPMDPTLTSTHGRLMQEWAQGVRDLPGQPQEDIVGILGFDYEPIFAPGTPPEIAGPTASIARWAAGVLSEAQAAGLDIADTLLTAPPPMPGADPQMALAVAAQRVQALATAVLEANPGAVVGPPPEVMNVPDELRDAPVARVTPPKPIQLPDPIVTTLAHAPDVRDFNLDPLGAAVRQAHVASSLWPGGGPAGELVATNEAALLDTDPTVVPVRQDEAGRILATVPSSRDMSEAHEVDITDGLKAAALPVGAEWKFNTNPSAGIAYVFNGDAERVLIDRSRSESRIWLREAQHEESVEALRNGQVPWKEDPVAFAALVLENPPQDIEGAQAAMREADRHMDRLRSQAPAPSDAQRFFDESAELWEAPRAYGEMMGEWWLDMAASEGTKALLLQNMSEMVQAENAALKARLEAEIEANRMMEEFATTPTRRPDTPKSISEETIAQATPEGIAEMYAPLTWYHGSGTEGLTAKSLDPLLGKTNSLMGHGVYLTDNPSVAQGYAKSRARGRKPVLYAARLAPQRVLDLDTVGNPEVLEAIVKPLSTFEGLLDTANIVEGDSAGVVFDKVMKATSEYSHQEMIPSSEFVEAYQEVVDNLKALGYDSMTYSGGRRTGKTYHRAMVILDPKIVQSFSPETLTGPEDRQPHGAAREGDVPPSIPAMMARVTRGGKTKLTAGADDRLLDVMGSNMYSGDIGPITVKESIQNALDALDALPKGSAKEVTIEVDENLQRVTVSDNGVGMTPKVVSTALVDVGGSFKAGDEPRGSYGLAKIAMYGDATRIHIETVAKVRKKGPNGKLQDVKVRSIVTGTGRDWKKSFSSKNKGLVGLDVEEYDVPDDTPTGTTVLYEYPYTSSFGSRGISKFMNRFKALNRDPNLKINFTTNRLESTSDAEAMFDEGVNLSSTKPVDTITGDGHTTKISASTKMDKTSKIPVYVLNRGFYQFTTEQYLGEAGNHPSFIVADVAPTGKTTDPNYPFDLNRQGLQYELSNQLEKFVTEKLVQKLSTRERDKYAFVMNEAKPLNGWTNTYVVDTLGEGIYPQGTTTAIATDPLIKRLDYEIGLVYHKLSKVFEGRGHSNAAIFRYMGFGVSPHYLGITVPGESIKKGFPDFYLMNPFVALEEITNSVKLGYFKPHEAPDELAKSIVATITHELSHPDTMKGWGDPHGETFSGVHTRMEGATLHERAAAATRIANALKENDHALFRALVRYHTDLKSIWSQRETTDIFNKIGATSPAKWVDISSSSDSSGSLAGGGGPGGALSPRGGSAPPAMAEGSALRAGRPEGITEMRSDVVGGEPGVRHRDLTSGVEPKPVLRRDLKNTPLPNLTGLAAKLRVRDSRGLLHAADSNAALSFFLADARKDPSVVAEMFDLDTVRQPAISQAVAQLKRATQETLKEAGFPEEFIVYRAGSLNSEFVNVSHDKNVSKFFARGGEPEAYVVKRSEILFDTERVVGNQSYYEGEFLVKPESLRKIGSVNGIENTAARVNPVTQTAKEMRSDVIGNDPWARHRDLTSDPFASRAAQARALTEARAWAATGQGWTGKAPLFKLLPPDEKFLAMATRITKGGIRFRAQLDALHPKNYPLNYHGGWTPTPEQRQSLSELYDLRVKEFNEAEKTTAAVRTAYDQRAAGKLPARIPVDKLLAVRVDELDEMIAKAPAQALEYMKHLHYNAFNAETDAEVARLADPERIKVAEELDLFREKLRDLEGEMVERMPHPSDPEVNPRVRWWDTLSHSHRMRMGTLKQLTRMVGNPANVLGPFKQNPSLSLLGQAWESGDLENNIWNILHEADFAKNKEAADIYDRWRRLHTMMSHDAALDKAVSRRLLFRMSKAELEKLPDDQSIPRSGLITKALPKTKLSEEMPELYRFFDSIIKDAAEAKTKILPGEMGQHKANIQHLEAERRERILAAVRVAGAAVEAYEDIPPEALDLVVKELRKNDHGTPGGDIWFNGEQMPSGAFSFSHIEEVIKAEKKAWHEKDEELRSIRSGRLYRQGYMTQIHQIARPQLEQMLRDPLSPYSRYVTAEWRNKFLQERDPDAKLPFATVSTTMPMYIEALLRTKHMEPAFQMAKSKLSSVPADMRAYAVEQLRALEHIEMPFDALNNRSIVEGSAHEPTGLDNLIEAATGRKRRDIVKEMQALGRADMRPMTTLVRNLNAIAYPLLLNIDRITAMSIGEMGFIPAVAGQGRPLEAVLNGAAAIPLQAFNALRAGGEGLTEFLAFLSNQTLGTPRYYSQATKEGQVTDVAYDFEKGGRHFGVPSQGAGPAMRAWHKIANNAFFPMKAAEYTIRSSQFYTIRTLMKRANPHMPEAVVNRLASAMTQRLIGSYGPMDVSPYLRGQGGKFWGALKKFGLNKLSFGLTQASGTYEAATTLGKGRPPLETGDQGIGPPQPPPPEMPGMEELAGDEGNPYVIDWGKMDPEEADRFMQMIVPASQMGAAFPAGKQGSRAAFVGTTMAGIPMAALAATVLNYILFYDDEAVDPTKLNPLSLGNIGEAAPTFWYKSMERYANLKLFGTLFGLNARQVKEKERIEKEMRYWVPFMGPMLRAYNRRKRLGVSAPGFPTFPQQGLVPQMIENTPVERGLAEAGKVVSGARKKVLEITETPAGRAFAP